MKIRDEIQADLNHIRNLTDIAFKPMSFSDGTEGVAIETLRDDGNLLFSLVAIQDEQIRGHIAFSPAQLKGNGYKWAALGPVAVLPEHQRTGIGSALINEGLERLKSGAFDGCVLIGNPAYYQRFGFTQHNGLTYKNVSAKNVMALSFSGVAAHGEISFSRGLE